MLVENCNIFILHLRLMPC